MINLAHNPGQVTQEPWLEDISLDEAVGSFLFVFNSQAAAVSSLLVSVALGFAKVYLKQDLFPWIFCGCWVRIPWNCFFVFSLCVCCVAYKAGIPRLCSCWDQDMWCFWSSCASGSGFGVALLHPAWFFWTNYVSTRRRWNWNKRESRVFGPSCNALKSSWSYGLINISIACASATRSKG